MRRRWRWRTSCCRPLTGWWRPSPAGGERGRGESGRTHLQDAVPITLAQEISWRTSLGEGQGDGGAGAARPAEELAWQDRRGHRAQHQGFDTAVAEAVSTKRVSPLSRPQQVPRPHQGRAGVRPGALKALAADLMKIANDACAGWPPAPVQPRRSRSENGARLRSIMPKSQPHPVRGGDHGGGTGDGQRRGGLAASRQHPNWTCYAGGHPLASSSPRGCSDCIRSTGNHCAVGITANREKCRHNLHNSLCWSPPSTPSLAMTTQPRPPRRPWAHLSRRPLRQPGLPSPPSGSTVFHPEEMV